MNLFITGGTGFLGSALLERIITSTHYDHIYVLVRESKGKSVNEKFKKLINQIFPVEQANLAYSKVTAIPGDLTKPGLAIGRGHLWELQNSVHQILHLGASTDFGSPLNISRMYNVEGTREVLKLARNWRQKGVLQRFDYCSTAFVAGVKRGIVSENHLDRGQKFANSYEQSKYEAERLVRSFDYSLPTVIYRPSIVVGDSKTGYTQHFNVLYWPLKVLSKGILTHIPFKANGKLDVVPVDFVADSMAALMQRSDSISKTYHLTAGMGNELTMGGLMKDAEKYADLNTAKKMPYWVFDVLMNTPLRKIFKRDYWETVKITLPYSAYLRGCKMSFDNRMTAAHLKQLGIECPKWTDYGKNIMSFCKTSRWGKIKTIPQKKSVAGELNRDIINRKERVRYSVRSSH